MSEYNESTVTKLMNEALVTAGREAYDKNELLNVVDIIWDLYEDSGMLDLDNDDDDLDEEAIVAHVCKLLAKDKQSPIKREDVPLIVRAELEYEASLEEF